MAEQHIGTTLLQLRWTVPEERVPDFAAWYDEEHLGDMAAVPGILGGRRFVRAAADFSSPTGFEHLTLYQLADQAPLTRPEYDRLATDPSPWTRRVAFDLALARTVYRQIRPAPRRTVQRTGSALLHVMMRAEPSVEEEFNGWYDEEHVPALLGVDGVLGARRFAVVDDGADFGGHAAQADFGYLAVYELADASVVDTPDFRSAGAPTPRRKRLGDAVRAHTQVYRQAFPATGAFETGD